MAKGLRSLKYGIGNQITSNPTIQGLEGINLSLLPIDPMTDEDIDKEDKQEIQVDAKNFVEKDISLKDVEEADKFGWQKVINMVPPNLRLMAQDVFKTSTDGKFDKVFTEKNLNKDYLNLLKGIALDNVKSGKTIINYEDYKSVKDKDIWKDIRFKTKGLPDLSNKRFNLKTTLGRAGIKIDKNNNLIITDRFNFDDSDKVESFSDLARMLKEIGGAGLRGEGYHFVRKIGKWFGSGKGEGQLVRINLGKVDSDDIHKHFKKQGGMVMRNPYKREARFI